MSHSKPPSLQIDDGFGLFFNQEGLLHGAHSVRVENAPFSCEHHAFVGCDKEALAHLYFGGVNPLVDCGRADREFLACKFECSSLH